MKNDMDFLEVQPQMEEYLVVQYLLVFSKLIEESSYFSLYFVFISGADFFAYNLTFYRWILYGVRLFN